MTTKRDIDALKLTKQQEREILAPENWPPGCMLTREGKLDIGKEQILHERRHVREGYQQRTIESLAKRVRDLERSRDPMLEMIGKWTAKAIREELRRRCVLTFAGVWQSDTAYERGNVVTHAGSLWVAIDSCKGSAAPGSKSADFKLIAKAGSAP